MYEPAHVFQITRSVQLTRSNPSNLSDGLGKPHSTVRSCGNIGRATVRCRCWEQTDNATGGDTPDSVRVRGEILVSEPEVAVWADRYTAHIEVILILRVG